MIPRTAQDQRRNSKQKRGKSTRNRIIEVKSGLGVRGGLVPDEEREVGNNEEAHDDEHNVLLGQVRGGDGPALRNEDALEHEDHLRGHAHH